MTLEEFIDTVTSCRNIKMGDKLGHPVATFDSLENIPPFLHDTNITNVIIDNTCVNVFLDYTNELGALDYLEEQITALRETLSDEYRYDNLDSVHSELCRFFSDLNEDVKRIWSNLEKSKNWDEGLE